MKSPLSDELTQELAQQQVERFVARFEPSYRYLACHCALPLVLTPELVNYIRVQFLLNEKVPWIAEADLLLSELCRPVGYELYAISPAVRSNLLAQFKKREFQQKFGSNRLKSVAQLLMDYVTYLMRTHPSSRQAELKAQQWAAMVYLDEHRERAEEEIATALQALVNREKNGQAELARLQRLIEEFRPQLSQYQPLIEFAKSLGTWLKGQIPPAAGQSYAVHGVKLRLPTPTPPQLLELETFEFEAKVATIVFEEETSQDEEKLQQWEFKTPTVNRRGETIKTTTHTASYFTETLTDSVDLEMVAIPGGTFTMGSPENEGSDRERPQHNVTISPFFMGKYPITQAQWKVIASQTDLKVKIDLDPDPSNFKGDDRPVEQVNWYEAVEFCQRLSKLTGRDYRLPSEAEWEYACRGVTEPLDLEKGESYPPFYFGETITSDLANYHALSTYADEPKGEESKKTSPVGQFPPNAFGLYDLHGNVWEWCADDWHDNYDGAPTDGSAWLDSNEEENINNENESFSSKNQEKESYSVLRGGSWDDHPVYCRSASRSDDVRRDNRGYDVGFRVVCGFGRTL